MSFANNELLSAIHYTAADNMGWARLWPDFTPKEIASRDTGLLYVDPQAMDALQAVRDEIDVPMQIVSGYRTPEHNRAIGGASRSQHMLGRAFDIDLRGHDPTRLRDIAARHGFNGFGYYRDSNFLHMDTRQKPTIWGDPFPSSLAVNPYQSEMQDIPPIIKKAVRQRWFKRVREWLIAGVAGVSAAFSDAGTWLLDFLPDNPSTDYLTVIAILFLVVLAVFLFYKAYQGFKNDRQQSNSIRSADYSGREYQESVYHGGRRDQRREWRDLHQPQPPVEGYDGESVRNHAERRDTQFDLRSQWKAGE